MASASDNNGDTTTRPIEQVAAAIAATTKSLKTSAVYELSWLVKLRQDKWQLFKFHTGSSMHRMTWQLAYLWEDENNQSVVDLKLLDACLVRMPIRFSCALWANVPEFALVRQHIGDLSLSGSVDRDRPSVQQTWFMPSNVDQLFAKEVLSVTVQLNAELQHYQDVRFDFDEYFNTDLLSDVQVVAGCKKFNVHKLVLAAQSPVLNQMLTTPTGQQDSQGLNTFTVEVDDDVSGDVFGHFLRYLYVNELDHSVLLQSGVAIALFDLSHKYDVWSLKRRTAVWLSQHLEVDTVLPVLHLADKHGHTGLRDACIVFLMSHSDEVTEQDEWEAFVQQHAMIVGATIAKMHGAAQKYQTRYYNAIEQASVYE